MNAEETESSKSVAKTALRVLRGFSLRALRVLRGSKTPIAKYRYNNPSTLLVKD